MASRRSRLRVSYFVAFRHLTSRHNRGFISFITLIAVVGVTLGVASLIITLSILGGFERTIKENVVSFTAHMQLFAFQNQLLPDPERTVRRVLEHYPEVTEMAPYLTREGMVKCGDKVDGVLIKGVDPSNDISAARRRLVGGTYDLDEKDEGPQTIIVGRRLAEQIDAKLGDRLLLYALGGADLSLSQTRVMQFEIRGIYETGMAEYDGSYVYINLRNAQRLFQVGKTVSGFDIMVSDLDRLPELSQRIPEELGYPYFARTMQQMYRNLFTWIDLQKKPIPIILGLITIVATVNIVGTLLMMVMEKSAQIGTLRALGMERKALIRIFLSQGVVIGLVGTSLGDALAWGLCWTEMRYRFFPLPSGVYFMTHVPIELQWTNFALVSGVALTMCFLASLFPARFAATLDPVRILRFS
ncbi:MAG TPA: ABC transporter permease [Bacteroidota bacterium]|nr:ABC transporter permease [Bacteroidota bacterium]